MKITHGGIGNRGEEMTVEMEGEAVMGAVLGATGGSGRSNCGKVWEMRNRAHNPLTRLSPFYILARIGP